MTTQVRRPGIDTSATLRFVHSPLRPALMLATAIVMTVICVGMALKLLPATGGQSLFPPSGLVADPATSDQITGRQQLYWGLGAVLFGIGTIAVWKNAFGAGRPALTVSPEGFHFNTISERTIPWSAVTGIHNWRQRRNKVMIVRITEKTWESAGMTREALASRATNKIAGIDGVAIADQGLSISFRDLIRVFQAYAEAHGGRLG